MRHAYLSLAAFLLCYALGSGTLHPQSITIPQSGVSGPLRTRCGPDAPPGAGGTLLVLVRDPEGHPVPDARVSLVDPFAGAVSASLQTNAHGSVRFKPLAGQRLVAVVGAPGFDVESSAVRADFRCEDELTIALRIVDTED